MMHNSLPSPVPHSSVSAPTYMSHLSEDFLLDPGPDSVGTLRLRLTVLVGVVALNLEVRLCPKLSRDVELGDEIVHEHLLPLVPAEVLCDVLCLI